MDFGKQIALVAALAAAAGIGAGGFAATTVDIPSPDQVAVTTAGAPQVVVDDPDDILTPDEEARLRSDVERLDAPDTVTTLYYLLLATTHDNVNDSVEEFFRANHPEAIGEDYFADGVLILGAGTDQRAVFAFGGEDVADQLRLRPGERLEEVNDAMKPGMRDNNIPAAMFAGARTATDAEAIAESAVSDAESDRGTRAALSGVGAGAAVAGVGGGVVVANRRRRKAIAQGREDYDLVTREYAQLAQRLDAVDIRANSLTSEFANEELRKDWAEVQQRFLRMHDSVSGAGGIGDINMDDDKEVLANRDKLAEAARTVRHTTTAEKNINRLFEVENGNAAARRSDLTNLREDVMRAATEVKDKELKARLRDLEERINWLDQNPEAPDYMDRFVRVLGDYQLVLDLVRTRQFSDVKEHNELERPRVYQENYYYPSYVPYVVLADWHSSNVAAEQAPSSSATNSSFSSGFSGSGGSSGY
ncbi:DUF5129 domain-containing protein [Corynebacterium timonense]|uniref:Uncharacterized membrane protein YgcG, contains a TPM-fold domain n=1 Tax=Corynebacterium timonense TaxID=441500 RepID=A0A1H1UJ71_9CORY|nr:DUF5129 domain-containing protein [Corynebacterium timonense]SDS72370.1 Uncharacterized membrane protein YgcG, contains a TPM-fold domain [Corynebacterium timonense]